MSLLLKEIMNLSERAAGVLRRAELNTDKDLKSLTRQDLLELFPGAEQLKLRRVIYDKIHKQDPVKKLLRQVKEFIPDQSFRDALTNNGVLVDYLQILKDMKSQMNNVQSFLDAHINLLEEYSAEQPGQKSTKPNSLERHSGQPAGRSQEARDISDSGDQMMLSPGGHPQGGLGLLLPATSGPVDSHDDQTGGFPQGERGSSSGTGSLWRRAPTRVTHPQQPQSEPFTVLSLQDFSETRLVYQMVVAGKTFDAHLQLMDKVKEQVQKNLFTESDEDYQVTVLFCPISSRVASDVEAAMADVKGNKPVILVLMHHTREVKFTAPMRTWREDIEVILHVNVYYHETVHGLLKCDQNNAAASQIRDKLLEYFLGAESELTGSISGRDGGNNRPAIKSSSTLSRLNPANWISGN